MRRPGIGIRGYFWAFVIAVLAISFPNTASANLEKRVALVIGNGAYENAVPLANPANDAAAMNRKLQSLGFVTVFGTDLNRVDLEAQVRKFAQLSRDSDLSLFFYAGHGIAVNGQNYIIPIDSEFKDSTAIDFEAISVKLVTRQMEISEGVGLVFLDACRDNPLATTLARSMGSGTRSASVSNGLAEMKLSNAGKGLAIAFATSPGEVAYDGDKANSPFTAALLEHIGAPDTDITEVMTRVTGTVYAETSQKQRPWLNTSLTGPVILNPQGNSGSGSHARAEPQVNAALIGSTEPKMIELDSMLFNLARSSDRIDDYRAYLAKFPDGLFSANARADIKRLEKVPLTQLAAIAPEASQNQSGVTPRGVPSVGSSKEFVLPVTPNLIALPANTQTESELAFDRQKRKEVQIRLKLAGFDVGAHDGDLGRKSRKGISDWQIRNGLQTTGFLNVPQWEVLVSQTQQAFASYTPPPTPAPSVSVRKSSKSSTRTSGTRRSTPRKSNNNNAENVGRFVGGVIKGILN